MGNSTYRLKKRKIFPWANLPVPRSKGKNTTITKFCFLYMKCLGQEETYMLCAFWHNHICLNMFVYMFTAFYNINKIGHVCTYSCICVKMHSMYTLTPSIPRDFKKFIKMSLWSKKTEIHAFFFLVI